MKIKGLNFIGTKNQVIYEIGEGNWNEFFEIFKESHPYFKQSILATTMIPVETYMIFQDAMLKELYNGDEKTYWSFGEEAAKTSLSEEGPFHIYVKRKREPKDFITKVIPRIWKMYYDGGSTKNVLEENIIHAYIFDLPFYHVYFEYITMGYLQKALELTEIHVKETIKVKGTAKEIYYKFVLDL